MDHTEKENRFLLSFRKLLISPINLYSVPYPTHSLALFTNVYTGNIKGLVPGICQDGSAAYRRLAFASSQDKGKKETVFLSNGSRLCL